MLVRGDRLPQALKNEVLRAYGYRWTVENLARAKDWHGHGWPTMQPITDTQWLARHAFWVTKAGQLHHGRRRAEPVGPIDANA